MSTAGTATATKSAPVNPESSTKANNNVSSVVTEAAAAVRINGANQTAPVLDTTKAAIATANASNTTTTTNTAATAGAETKEEPRGGSASDVPLPPDVKRILAEVARSGSCSWLSWSSPSAAPSGETAPNSAPATSAATTDTAHSSAPAVAAAAAAALGSNSANKSAPPFAAHAIAAQPNRRPYNRLGIGPPRKKHRNGVKVKTTTTAGGHTSSSRKRPLFLIRTSASSSSSQHGGSVGSSGRTSGSEPDDSTQYECDSEGTSATSCSELSTERSSHSLRNNRQRTTTQISHNSSNSSSNSLHQKQAPAQSDSSQYRCLKDVFRMALGVVLDHWYRHKGGYKLSPAEKRRSQAAETANANNNNSSAQLVNGESHKKPAPPVDSKNQHPQPHQQPSTTKQATSEGNKTDTNKEAPQPQSPLPTDQKSQEIFHQRRQRLLMMLGQQGNNSKSSRRNPSTARRYQGEGEGPPFTIQRIAEVLIAPERYYTQTHKLCNCLEKLLLVTSSTSAFGGSTGGITSQSRLEERELAALASEKGRLESEFRQRALKRRCSSSMSDDMQTDSAADAASRTPGSPSRGDEGPGQDAKSNSPSPEKKADGEGSESSSREMLEAAARQLRTKFDHVGIDPHSPGAVSNRDVRSIAENRGMTNSPPPPSLAMSAAAASNIALPGHSAVGNFVRQHHPEQNPEHPSIARVPSPILFSQGNESANMAPLHAPPNMHLIHMHHAAPLAGVSVGSTPFDVVTIEAGASGATAPTSTNLPGSNEGADLEGRSSASNSDVDSESDDVSFDDSASDRSDGSDSGHYEPFTAARAMALNRIQQQQRLQSRGGLLTSLALHQSEGGFTRPPADSEYQSGDSIDSTRGEDSGGSDSSSSDLAD